MKRLALALAFLVGLLPTSWAQNPPFIQNLVLPPRTVIGNPAAQSGPASAIPYSTVAANMFPTGGAFNNPTALWPITSFGGSGSTGKAALGLQTIWDAGNGGLNGGTVIFDAVVNPGAGSNGAASGMVAGVRITGNITGLDAAGGVFNIYNDTAVTSPVGTAIYALVRGPKATNSDLTQAPDGIRSVSEVNAGQHPRAGVVVFNSNSTNQYRRGFWVTDAVDYGVLVGSDLAPLSTRPAVGIAVRADNLGVVSYDGMLLHNPTAAAVGAQQMSPRLRWTGQGWKTDATAASQTVDWIAELLPIQGAANPSSQLKFSHQINGTGFTASMWLETRGTTGSAVAIGTVAPAATLQGGDLQIVRAGGTTGTLYFGSTANGFIFFDGTNFITQGAISTNSFLKTGTTTVGSLPTCNAAARGTRYFVTDGNTANAFRGAVTAGGANNQWVVCDGAAWLQG